MTTESEIVKQSFDLADYGNGVGGQVSTAVGRIPARVVAYLSGKETLSRRDLEEIRRILREIAPEVAQEVRQAVREAIETLADTSTPQLVEALSASGINADPAPARKIAAELVQSPPKLEGQTWLERGDRLVAQTLAAIDENIRQKITANAHPDDAISRVQSIANRVNSNAQGLGSSLTTHVSNTLRLRQTPAVTDDFAGWLYRAVVDTRTGAICRGLDGSIWLKGRNDIPVPPRHPHCRSQLIPLTQADIDALPKRETRIVVDALNNAVDSGTKLEASGEAQTIRELLIKAGQGDATAAELVSKASFVSNYEGFFAKLPRSEQQRILGPTRFKLWEAGTPFWALSSRSRPLSNKELRNLYPDKFEKAA